MGNKPKLEATLNANAFHPPFGKSMPAAQRLFCASAVVKEHLINHQRTMAISAAPAPHTMSRIAGTLRA